VLEAAAPWLCLIWGAGIVAAVAVNAHFARTDDRVWLAVDTAPWILVVAAIMCVGWPGLFIYAAIFGVNRADE